MAILPTYVPLIGGLGNGKSTARKHIAQSYPSINTLEEAAYGVLQRHGRENGLFGAKSAAIVEEILESCTSRLEDITAGKFGDIVVEESGLIGCYAHLRADGYGDLASKALANINRLLPMTRTTLLYVHCEPQVAWGRRRERYAQQVKRWKATVDSSADETALMQALERRFHAVDAEIRSLYEMPIPIERRIGIENRDVPHLQQDIDSAIAQIRGDR